MPLVTVRGKANQDSKSAWTERKITVSANIYSGARGGNVRLDSDSELISFEIPSPILPSTSSTSATHSSPFSPSLFPSHPGSLFATLAFLFSHSPSLSLSLSLFLSLSIYLYLYLTPSFSLFSSLSSFSNLVRVSDAYILRPGRNAFRSAPFSTGRICVSSFQMEKKDKH